VAVSRHCKAKSCFEKNASLYVVCAQINKRLDMMIPVNLESLHDKSRCRFCKLVVITTRKNHPFKITYALGRQFIQFDDSCQDHAQNI
jgi:hypothetical protein